MLLAIDIGNSSVSLGVFRGGTLLLRRKISSQLERSADEYAAALHAQLAMGGLESRAISGCILSSVVPGLTSLVAGAVEDMTKAPPLLVGPGIRTGFRIRIDDPSQLGGDLVADTLAALTDYGPPLILIDAGTVTTIAAVDSDRTYLGGCILPGVRQSAALFKESTALLPAVSLTGGEEACLGRNSADAIRRGLLLGSAMMVDGFVDRYLELPKMAGAGVVATGGSVDLATAACRRRIIRDRDLTLKGLRYLYELNRPKRA